MRCKGLSLMVAGGMAVLLIAGCAGRELEVQPLAITENPTEQISQLAQQISKGRTDQLNVLTPMFFSEAEASLAQATALRDRGGDIARILEAVAEGQALVKKAKEMSEVAQLTLPRVIDARRDAQTVGATRFEEDYADAEDRFLKLTRAIEKNDLRWAEKNEARVVNEFRALELRAITQEAVGPAEAVIRQAEAKGAKGIAPKTLAVAEMNLRDARDYISKNRYEKDGIQRKAREARFYADRLLQITLASNQLREMDSENIALWVEGILYDIGAELKASDRRDQSLSRQVDLIEGTIRDLRTAQEAHVQQIRTEQAELAARARAQQEELLQLTQARERELEDLKEQLASIKGRSEAELEKKRRLEAQIKFNELFMEVQTYFETDEAEVYKQGDNLLVRLKGMRFPVGQHVIMPANFALLSKVQRAIRAFGDPTVVVEGHTDSTGSDTTNRSLSQLRAESVREYLVANGVVTRDQVQAVGFGSAKPLASNETTEGRALNRRIDLIIHPAFKTGG